MTKFVGKFVTGSVVAAALAFSLCLPSAANAQGRRGASQRMQSLHQRETRQIGQMVRNGSLTRAQAKNLENHMSQLQNSIKADKAKGNLSPQEAAQMKNETKKIEKAINGTQYSNTPTATPHQ